MDLNQYFVEQHTARFIESRLESARTYREGTGSFGVAMIGRTAAGLRRAAAAVERWATGTTDIPAQTARRLSIR